MNQPICILEVHKDDDGTWRADEQPVSSSHDIDTVDSLEGYATETAAVHVLGETKTITVYRDGDDAFVTYDDAY